MKTSAISSPANLTSGTASSTKTSGAVADAPFSQMLSREMTARPAVAEPAKPAVAQASKNAQATKADNSANKAKPADDSDTTTSSENSTKSTNPDTNPETTSDTTATTKAANASDSKSDQDDETTVTAASAELLALVASLTQPAVKQAADSDPTEDTEQITQDVSDDDAAKSRGKAQDLSLASDAAAALHAPLLADQQESAQIKGDADLEDGPVAITARRGVGPAISEKTGADASLTSIAAQRRSDRADAAILNSSAGQRGFDAKLTHAKNEKPTVETSTGKRPAGEAKLSDVKTAAERPAEKPANSGQNSIDERLAAKSAQELQQPVMPDQPVAKSLQDGQQPATQFNINALTASHTPPATPAPTHMTDILTPRVGSQGWDQALGQKVVWMVGGEQQSASLTLNPPDLGPLQVVLHVSDNQATANFTAAQPEVRQALEAAMPKLREMLGDAGIQLSQANVSAGTPNNQHSAFNQPQHSARQGGGSDRSESADAAPVRTVRSQTISGGQGLVDTFA